MKKCTGCSTEKEDSEFYTKKRSQVRKDGSIHYWTGLYAKCKKCHDAINYKNRHLYQDYYKQYRKENKEKIREKTEKYYVSQKTEWWSILGTLTDLKCAVCGYNKHSAALDFHHVDPEEKETTIHQLISGPRPNEDNIKVLKKELDKCIILCSNCHREHHAKYNFLEKMVREYKKKPSD